MAGSIKSEECAHLLHAVVAIYRVKNDFCEISSVSRTSESFSIPHYSMCCHEAITNPNNRKKKNPRKSKLGEEIT